LVVEKRFKRPFDHFRGHPAAGVADRQPHIIAGRNIGIAGGIGRIESQITGFNPQIARRWAWRRGH
jgi:hypothetical protein